MNVSSPHERDRDVALIKAMISVAVSASSFDVLVDETSDAYYVLLDLNGCPVIIVYAANDLNPLVVIGDMPEIDVTAADALELLKALIDRNFDTQAHGIGPLQNITVTFTLSERNVVRLSRFSLKGVAAWEREGRGAA